jgi:hypothetical protein
MDARNHHQTVAPISVAAATPLEPEFIRLPRAGERDPVFGLSRSYLNQLILPCRENEYRSPVKSVVLRRRGARTGVRLIDLDSLKSYIKAHVDEGSVSTEENQSRS